MGGYELLEALNPVPETRGDPGSVPIGKKTTPNRVFGRLIAAACVCLVAGLCAFALWDRGPEAVVVSSQASDSAIPTAVVGQPVPSDPEDTEINRAMPLLPDRTRWVVVDDFGTPDDLSALSSGDLLTFDGVQLIVAPLDPAGNGVPELQRRIHLSYSLGAKDDFDREWGDRSVTDRVDFSVDDGIARTAFDAVHAIAWAQVWINGTFVSMQTTDPDIDLAEVARSLSQVNRTTWAEARAKAEGQRLIAVEAALENVEPRPPGAPLPHWVLPEPWQLDWVTDKTIWTPEQQAQAIAFREIMQSQAQILEPDEHRLWHFGFAESAEAAASQFVPAVTVSMATFAANAVHLGYPTNYEKISALGLDGVISQLGSEPSILVELGTGDLRIGVVARNIGKTEVREFLTTLEFAGANPLDGLVVQDVRYQPVTLADPEGEHDSWHAAWNHPESGADAVMSVRRLTVPALRVWLQNAGRRFAVPTDAWETVAAGGIIDLGGRATYDVSEGLLIELNGVTQDDLLPISLEDWIVLASPVNADPVNPR